MSQKHVTTRVSEDLYEKIERVQEEEQTDRSTAVKRLLERGVGDWQIETAVRRYRKGSVSIGRAAKIADVSIWELLDILEKRGVEMNYGESDLEADFAAVRDDE
jgi:predicted HTH domain antitoxin